MAQHSTALQVAVKDAGDAGNRGRDRPVKAILNVSSILLTVLQTMMVFSSVTNFQNPFLLLSFVQATQPSQPPI